MRHLLIVIGSLALIGAGCAAGTSVTPGPQVPPVVTPSVPTPPVTDPYEGWKTMESGGIVSFRIPPNCEGDPGAGTIFIVCPTSDNDTPVPEMTISSDGMQVNIRRWEQMESYIWDDVVASLRVLTPLDHAVQINIEK